MTPATRRLCANLEKLRGVAALIDASSAPWRSIRLAGERHRVRLMLNDPDADKTTARLQRTLAEHEFALPGLLVADLVVTATERTPVGVVLTLEVLTLDEELSPARRLC